ncbi:MAG: ferric reductase-like transmembrane domain-containing protein [Chloroflexota bacterium]|nr:ferric reductase-like transmembrane domain-containing protein [Chloroflexota bacterium]
MSLWEAVTWDVARAGGFTAYMLLTLAVAIGLALSVQLQSPRWPRIINSELHNFLTLLSLIFVGVHVLAVWIDPFTRFGWNEVFIPLMSYYRPLWMALGIVALYLGLAIGISTWVRPWIGYTWWRRLHVFTLLAYALVTLHGIATGSDTQTAWGVAIYAASVALVGGLLLRRLLVPVNARSRSHPGFAVLTGVAVLIGIVWAVVGPFQAGWGAEAGTLATASAHSSSNSAVTSSQAQQAAPPQAQQATPQTTNSQDPFATAFTATAQGTMTENGPDTNGNETLRLNTTLSNGAQGVLTVVLQGQQESGSDSLTVTSTQVSLGTDVNTPLYRGQLQSLSSERRWRMTAVLTGIGTAAKRVQVQMNMLVTSDGQVSGTVQGTPVSSTSS